MRSLLTLGALALVTVSGSPSSVSAPIAKTHGLNPPPIQKAAPPFVALDESKRQRTPADLKGRRALLLTFFPKCFTGNCARQLTSLRDSYPALQKAGVEVWAISTDPAEGAQGQRAFAKHLKLPFPLLSDTSRKISLAFGAVQSKDQMAARMTVLIDMNGIVRWVDKQINPRTHGTDVLVKMRELGMTTPASPNG